ncbi:MAG TPA: glycosyltransferase family 4 protein [Leptolyngbyaceae cyanobacterium]
MPLIKVIMLGASLEQNGGIATVEKHILKYCPQHIQIHHITTHDEGSIAHRILVFGRAIARFFAKLFKDEVDIVHIHLSDGGSVLRKAILTLIATIFNKPVLIHAHGAEFHSTFFKLPIFARQIIGRIFQQSAAFIVLSKTWQDFYISHLGLDATKVFVLSNPVELPTQLPNRAGCTHLNLAFFGRVGQRKGTFDLINAFAQFSSQHKEQCHLFIAGDGEIEKGKALVKELGLEEKITFLGWINSQQRDDVLKISDIFLLPSYNEGLPMAILEAMGWELPIVTTPVGGIPEVIISGKNGLLVNPGDVQQLSAAIQLLVEDESLRLSMGRLARETVAPFKVENYCDRLTDIYHQVTPTLNEVLSQ